MPLRSAEPLAATPNATLPAEPRLDLLPQLTVVAEKRDDLVVLRVPKYRGWGERVARTLRLPTEKRVILDAKGSRAVALMDGDRDLAAIAEAVAGPDAAERSRLFAFLGILASHGWLTLREPSGGKA